MKIAKRRIRNIWPYLNLFGDGESFFISLTITDSQLDKIRRVGFSYNLDVGEQLLPSIRGPISKYNASGKYLVRRDLPMETVYRQSEWHWKDWGGNDHAKIVDIPYNRYPREFLEPPSEELRIVLNEGVKNLLSKELINTDENALAIKHLINLFLELFGECELLKPDLLPPVTPEIIRLNWRILPPGEYPWDKVEEHITDIIQRQSIGKRPVVKFRIETISGYNPDFVAIGQAGFDGYLVFGFRTKGKFVFESTREGNATYIFLQNWEALSRFTKREILSRGLQDDRIIHREGWDILVRRHLN